MDFITQTKEVPVVGSYDVVVCGGGPAGLIAAIGTFLLIGSFHVIVIKTELLDKTILFE